LELSLPYVAGLFDGDGSVGIYQGRSGGWTFRVQMIQNERYPAMAHSESRASGRSARMTRVAADQLKRLKRQDIDRVMVDAVHLVEEQHAHLQMVNVQGE
jgi:hypothetical protein